MHYYKRHIGDYAKKAGHLSPLEHGVYNLIIDSYYDREQAPTMAEAIRWARARSDDERAAVAVVLAEFFTLDGDVYRQNRIEEELAAYHGKAKINQQIAIQREEQKRLRKQRAESTEQARETHEENTNRARTVHDAYTSGQPNHKPLTTNQEPEDKVKTTVPPDGETRVVPIRDSVAGQVQEVFTYWQQQRGKQRAKLDDKRSKAIRGRLKDGYSVGDLCEAIDGIAHSRHHMGENEHRTVYDDIELICRNGPNVDRFRAMGTHPAMAPAMQRQIDVLREFIGEEA